MYTTEPGEATIARHGVGGTPEVFGDLREIPVLLHRVDDVRTAVADAVVVILFYGLTHHGLQVVLVGKGVSIGQDIVDIPAEYTSHRRTQEVLGALVVCAHFVGLGK